jgi:aminoglycoside phosphotransferase
MILIPESIKILTQEQKYDVDETGMSGATLFLYETMVLKIQEISLFSRIEIQALEWLSGKVHVPRVISYSEDDNMSYLLMSRLDGVTLDQINQEDMIIDVLVKALHSWWRLDVTSCPVHYSLQSKLDHAYDNIINDRIDVEHANDETYHELGFKDPCDLFHWLSKHQPKEDAVVSHGDFTFENIVIKDQDIGFIDFGKFGISDRWQDIALAYRGLCYHFDLKIDVYQQHRIKRKFFKQLGIRINRKKLKYYILLDELS